MDSVDEEVCQTLDKLDPAVLQNMGDLKRAMVSQVMGEDFSQQQKGEGDLDKRVCETDESGKEWIRVTDDAQVWKHVIHEAGEQHEPGRPPFVLGRVWVNIRGQTAKGKVFEEHMFEERDFILGEAQSCKGVEIALATMTIGQQCLVRVHSPKYSYSDAKRPLGCPETAGEEGSDLAEEWPLQFYVALIDAIPPQKKSYEMEFSEQLKHAEMLREKGNARYAKGRLQTAVRLYKKSLQCLNAMSDLDACKEKGLSTETTHTSIEGEKVKSMLNVCVSELRSQHFHAAVDYATQVLELDSANLKALLRRAMALRSLDQLSEATKDVRRYLKLVANQDDSELDKSKLLSIGRKQLALINRAKKQTKDAERKVYGGFLESERVSLYTDKTQPTDSAASQAGAAGFFQSIVDSLYQCIRSLCPSKGKED